MQSLSWLQHRRSISWQAIEYNKRFLNAIIVFIVTWASIVEYCDSSVSVDFNDSYAASALFGAPLITPTSSDYTLEVNSNFTLRCESDTEMTWKLPDISDEIRYKIEAFTTEDPKRPFASTLTLYDVSAYNVGEYYCLPTAESDVDVKDLESNFKASGIYIYVNDPENLLVPVVHPVITAYQFSDVIIPCKPTSKNVDVELVNSEDESKRIDTTGRYDPTVGFVVKIVHLSDGGTYLCRPKNSKDHHSGANSIHFSIFVLMGSEFNTDYNNCTEVETTTTARTATVRGVRTRSKAAISPITLSSDSVYTTKFTTQKNVVGSSEQLASAMSATATVKPLSHRTTASSNFYSNNVRSYSKYKISRKNGPSLVLAESNPLSSAFSNNKNDFTVFKPKITKRTYNNHPRPTVPIANTEFISKPYLESATGPHATQGGTIKLTCTIDVANGVLFSINWVLPNHGIALKENRVKISDATKEPHVTAPDLMTVGKSVLFVHDVDTKKDGGYYICEVTDHSQNKNSEKKQIIVLDANSTYLNLFEPSGHYEVYGRSKKGYTNMGVICEGYPEPILTWYDPRGKEIPSGVTDKYTVEKTGTSFKLKIKSLELTDSGIYSCRAHNNLLERKVNFTVYVQDKPTVDVEKKVIRPGESVTVACDCAGFPSSEIKMSFTPCDIAPEWPTCRTEAETIFSPEIEALTEFAQRARITFTPEKPGIVTCSAENADGNDKGTGEIILTDLDAPFTIYGVDENTKIADGDEVHLTCAAQVYNHSSNINWYRNDVPVEPSDDIELTMHTTDYSYKRILTFKRIKLQDAAVYECVDGFPYFNNTNNSISIEVNVFEPEAPIITASNLNGTQAGKKLGDSMYLECRSSGLPLPTVTWYKNGERLVNTASERPRIIFRDNNSSVLIPFIKPEDQGEYKCHVSNRLGQAERSTEMKITNLPKLALGWILGICGFILLLLILVVFLCIRIYRERKLLKELKAAGLANFEEGAIEQINYALSLDEQAELLPYDRRFEFPKEKLRLGKQLGAGAFGVVLKAIAEGIVPDEKETTVAVKMVKKTADNEVMKALVSELKIMVHMGQHLNVVNLLGAITKNIAKREVMVIVEYCRYGNVQNFLLKNRKRFVNQINHDTDLIDPTITTRDQRLSSDYEYNSKGDRKSGMSNEMNSRGYIRHPGSEYVGENVDSCNTEQTLITSRGDESVMFSNNSVQPAWRSNYKPDCPAIMDINTTHLVSWAFQVARGMDYLSSKKVLHGDLAARNILLCDDNIVKICDFGLARSMYRGDNYKKSGEAPLPIKWLALESLGDQVFSTYSDIWSYGIVLWEFFSLAKTPYPGMEADQTLYLKLKDGYRMEKPEYANQELYDIMLECWRINPESRPIFSELEKKFSRMLEDDVSNHYIDLNEPYLRVNSDYFKRGNPDYLSQFSCPDEPAPEPPRYVNGLLPPAPKDSSDYLHMSPQTGTAIFSPRPKDEEYVKAEHFTFPERVSPTISNNLDLSPVAKSRKKNAIPEEIPMLKHHNINGFDSDQELSPDSETGGKKFSHLTDKENYINLSNMDLHKGANKLNNSNVLENPNNKKLQSANEKDAFSNPSYLFLSHVNETNNKRK